MVGEAARRRMIGTYIEYDEKEENAPAEQAWSERLQTGIGFPMTLSELSRYSDGLLKRIGGTGPFLNYKCIQYILL
jgi:hypothetical protein